MSEVSEFNVRQHDGNKLEDDGRGFKLVLSYQHMHDFLSARSFLEVTGHPSKNCRGRRDYIERVVELKPNRSPPRNKSLGRAVLNLNKL